MRTITEMDKQEAENLIDGSHGKVEDHKRRSASYHGVSRFARLIFFVFLSTCIWHLLIGSPLNTAEGSSRSIVAMVATSLRQAIHASLAAIAIASPSCHFNLYEHLGNLSPYFQPSNTLALSSGFPPGCSTSRAFLVHRHGSRNPLSDEIGAIRGLAYYLGNESALFSSPQAPVPDVFAFLQEEEGSGGWNSTFTTNDLTEIGRKQLRDHGAALRRGYPQLSASRVLVGDQERVVESARSFMETYFANATADLDLIAEDNKTVSWITPMDTCAAWQYSLGGALVSEWGKVYLPPLADRINKLLQKPYPRANFTAAHCHGMLWACAYGTAVHGKNSSPWCEVFQPAEILAFEYELDLLMRGAFGYGLPGDMGPVLGGMLVGNMTEFLLNDDVNETLSLNFGHDTTIDLGLTALNLAADESYPTRGPVNARRHWRTARQVPFAAQMLFHRLDCDGGERRIQLLLNEANFDLGPSGCESDEYGTCEMSDFTASETVKAALAVRHGDARWQAVCST
ncbi:acid phosphatase pho5 [Apiospora arundinis]|uniref:Phosphoglycerate mutase-like protein n=1 Tax=Apiospora arundinis TaxID=335852 RepID=A0ABR2ITR9_9PEZI